MSTSADSLLRLLDTRLKQLQKKNHIPDVLAALVKDVFTMQVHARDEATTALDESLLTPREQLGPDVPLLPRESFPVDEALATRLFDDLLALILDAPAPLGDAAKTIDTARKNGAVDLPALFAAYISGDDAPFAAWAEKTPDAPRAMAFLVQSSLTPGLRAVAQQAEQHLKLDEARGGNCPVCGSLPLITELREKQGFRHATCSFCHTVYRIPRIMCAFCGETDMDKLSYFTAEGETGYRVDVCESCKLYIKCADFRELDRKTLALIDDLDSLSLDILAVQDGYTRPTVSALGF